MAAVLLGDMRVLLSWSSGKDCAWALHVLRTRGEHEVVGLLTTINTAVARVSMHAVREEVLDRQAAAVGLPLVKVRIPAVCSNSQYEAAMGAALGQAARSGIEAVAFGDLFLEEVRRYREQKLAPTGIAPLFPLWGKPTGDLAYEMVTAGMQAYVTCVDPRQLDRSFAGRAFNHAFLSDLPESVDRCGENGEFHSFAFAGPMFSRPLGVAPGRIVERGGFVYADLLLSGSKAGSARSTGEEESSAPAQEL